MPANGDKTRIRSPAFTLVEVMVVIIVVGALTAFGIPSFQRAMEQSRVDIAAANLRAIWAAQRLYWLEYHEYSPNLDPLNDLELLDSEIMNTSTGFLYSTESTEDGFETAADRTGTPHWSGTLTIDQTGAIDGNITSGDGKVITPGSR
ncbi:MAG: prepilin-type N-terminal cleavage/methylation domain-containing protein [Pirellulaceae bacterium]|nr:prepilin-type N-terminal cleavage/methylation domain-containing protein [Pirellulaceae bacterium]